MFLVPKEQPPLVLPFFGGSIYINFNWLALFFDFRWTIFKLLCLCIAISDHSQ